MPNRWYAPHPHEQIIDYNVRMIDAEYPELTVTLEGSYGRIVFGHCESLTSRRLITRELGETICVEVDSVDSDTRPACWRLPIRNLEDARFAAGLLSVIHDAIELEDKKAPIEGQQHLILYPVFDQGRLVGVNGAISPEFLGLLYGRRDDTALWQRATDIGLLTLALTKNKSPEEIGRHTIRPAFYDPCGFQFTHSSGDVPTIACNMQLPTKSYVQINDKHIYDAVTALALMMPIYALYTELKSALIGK